MPYQVVWARLNAFDTEGVPHVVERGDFVPPSIDTTQLAQLATIGAIQFVDTSLPPLPTLAVAAQSAPLFVPEGIYVPDEPGLPVELVSLDPVVLPAETPHPVNPEAEPMETGEVGTAEPLTEAEVEQGDEPQPPAKSAPKEDWVDFAVAQGMPDGEAASRTKAELQEQFG